MRFGHSGFTFAELITSVAILAIVSAASFMAFERFASNAAAEMAERAVVSAIEEFDRKIREGTVGSYEIRFEADKPGFTVVIDGYGLSDSGSLVAYDWSSWSGTVQVRSSNVGVWTVRLSKNGKFLNVANQTVQNNGDFLLAFPLGRDDELAAAFFFGGEPKNRVLFRPYDSSNPLATPEARLVLSSIQAGPSKKADVVVRSAHGKKEMLSDGLPVWAVSLTFSRWGKQWEFELRK